MTPSTSTSIDRRRGQQRVPFDGAVQVLPPGSQQTLWVRAANLSESGIFVASRELFGVGTEIGLRLPLPSDGGSVNLRGRVVRLCNGTPPGMGIAFDGLDEIQLAVLRRAVERGRSAEWVRPAKVWFAGTSQPTCVQASVGPEGLRLFCDLGFLQLGLPVTLFFSDEEDGSYTGVLRAANLQTDPEQQVPRLELSVVLHREPADAGQTWTYWPPPPVCGDSDNETGSQTDGALAEPAAGDPFQEASSEELEDDDHTVEVVIEAAPAAYEDVFPLTQGRRAPVDTEQRAVSGAIEARQLPSPELPCGPSVQAPTLLADESDPGRSAALEPDWVLEELPTPAQSHWALRSEEVVLPKGGRRRGSLWMWLLALTMAGLTVASMTYTNLWQRVSDRLLRPRPEPRQGSLLSIEPPLRVLGTLDRNPDPIPSGGVALTEESPDGESTEAAAQQPLLKEAPAADPSATEEPPASLEPDGSTLIIPIEGSLTAARQYVLARPDGVAVNLPHARPKVRFGNYVVQRGGFRVVWVRHRLQGGLHLRVLHDPDSVAEVQLTPRAVRVTLRPETPAAPPTDGDSTP